MENGVVTINTSIEATSWLAEKDEFLAKAAGVTECDSNVALEIAGGIEAAGKKLVKKLEAKRKELTSPLDDIKKQIMAKEKELSREIVDEVARINKMTTAYATKLAAEREAELRRIAEEERKAAEAAVAAEESGANALFGLDGAENAYKPVKVEPTISDPHTTSNRFVETWKFDVIDPNKVPRELLSVDESKIRTFLKAKKMEGYKADQLSVAGLRIYAVMQVQSR